MPYSLRFLFALFGLAGLLALGGVLVSSRQEKEETRVIAEQLSGGNAAAGKLAIARYGCGGCHEIQGIAGADGRVGPSLGGIAVRAQIAGHLGNTPGNMVRWLRDPQSVAPGNGMPNLGVSDRDARDMAAYLYTLTPAMPPAR